MKRKIAKVFCYLLSVVIFLAGLLIFIYPMVNKAVIDNNAQANLQTFRNIKTVYNESKTNDAPNNDETGNNEKLDDFYKDMKKYNQRIYEEGQSGLKDAWSYEQAGFNLSSYGIYNGVIGEIRIPAMNCDLPLYMGATLANMAKGAAQLGQTSAPIGGENTNCVIAAHRGASGGDFFKEIQLLKLGDKVYIDNFWDSLTYKVTKIEIISPDEISKVLIQPGKDMITLTTCHPYPYNYQRYIVYCERVTENELQSDITDTEISTEIQMVDTEDASSTFMAIEYIMYVSVPVILVLLFVILTFVGRKKRKVKSHSEK